jgi:outer membrane autotransporter protein
VLGPVVATQAGPLADLVNNPQYAQSFGPVEIAMAESLDAAFEDARPLCAQGNGTCPSAALDAFNLTMNRLYTAIGQQQGAIPPAMLTALAGGLRGSGPEELSALRLLSNEFAADQRDQILSRLNGRRLGSTAAALNGNSPGSQVASTQRKGSRTLIGGASADDVPADFSRWGGFFNVQNADGKRDASALEDGFDLSGVDVSLGADYLLDSNTVLGGMIAYVDRKAVFAGGAATQGRIASSGVSAVLYGSRQWDDLYLAGSIGFQKQSNHIRRFVHIAAPLPVLDAINTGDTDSSAFTVTLDAGRTFHKGAFGFEPIVRVLYRNTRYDAFVEESVDLATNGPSGLAMAFDDTTARTLNGALAMRVNYTLTPSFGVLVPYAQYEVRHEFTKRVLKTQADFADILAAGVGTPGSSFELSSERPDATYYQLEAGASAVFKHGVQAFLSARSLFGLRRADLLVVSAGVRMEF